MRIHPLPRRFVLAVGAAALLAPQFASAEVLEHFTFGTAAPAVLTPTTVGVSVTGSAITGGTGVTLDLASAQGNPPASAPWLRVVPTAAFPTAADAITGDARFLFTLAAIPGFTMDLTSLDFNVIKGGNSQRGFAVQTSEGQLGAGPWAADVPTYRGQTVNGVLSPWTPVSITLADAAYQDLSTITFSIYSYSPGSGASVEYDDIIVNGSTVFSGYTWQGATGVWDTAAPNWSGPGTTYVDATADSKVLFSDAGTTTNVAVGLGGLRPNLVTLTNDTKDYTFSGGNLNIATSLFKSGDGTATFNNVVTAGSVTADRGTLAIGAGGTLVTEAITVNGTLTLDNDAQKVAALNGAATGVVELDGVDLDNNDFEAVILEVTGDSTFAGKLTGEGSLLKSTGGTLVLSGSTSDFIGGTTVTGGALQLGHASAAGLNEVKVNSGGTLLLGANIANVVELAGGTLGVSAASTPTGTLNVTADSTVATYNTVSGAGSADLVLAGSLTGTGDITLATINGNNPDTQAFRLRGPASDYSGTITVPQSGKFEVQTAEATGSPMGTGTLVLTGGETTSTVNGTYSLVNVRNNSTGNTVFGNDVEIAGPGTAYFNMLVGAATPAGAEAAFGDLLVGDGQTVGAVATGAGGYTLAFETVHLTGGNATFVPGAVGNTSFLATQNIRLGAISENVAGSGITVDGVGTLTLDGVNTYTGPTLVDAGTLSVEGSIAGSAVTVNGGILSGDGATGGVTLAGGTLAPGKGLGILDTGDLVLDAGTLAFQLGGSTPGLYDQINVTGLVSLNAPVALTLDFSTYDPADGVDQFVLISNNLTDVIGGSGRLSFAGTQLDEGAIFTATSGAFTQAFQISYAGGDGANDIVLAAVPEPTTAATLVGGVALLAGFRRRRR